MSEKKARESSRSRNPSQPRGIILSHSVSNLEGYREMTHSVEVFDRLYDLHKIKMQQSPSLTNLSPDHYLDKRESVEISKKGIERSFRLYEDGLRKSTELTLRREAVNKKEHDDYRRSMSPSTIERSNQLLKERLAKEVKLSFQRAGFMQSLNYSQFVTILEAMGYCKKQQT